MCWLCWWSCAWADELHSDRISDSTHLAFKALYFLGLVVFCCRLTIKISALFSYASGVAEKKSRTCLRQALDCPAVLVVLTWYLERYVKLAGIISRQWALSNLCIIKNSMKDLGTLEGWELPVPFSPLNLLHLMLWEEFQLIEKSSVLQKHWGFSLI